MIRRRRVPYVAQLELAECGAACVAMVLAFHGACVPLPRLREVCGISRDGASARSLLLAARHFGLHGRALKVPLEALKRVPMPAILHWGLNHFVVVERVRESGIDIIDPAGGRRGISAQELARSFTGVVLSFEKTASFRPIAAPASPRLLGPSTVKACREVAVLVVLASLLLELVSLVFPASDQFIIDQVVMPLRARWLYGVAAALALTTVVAAALNVLRRRALLSLGFGLDLDLTTRFVHHLQSLPLGFFQQRSAGDLMQRTEANHQLRELATQIVTGALDALLVLGFSAMMLAYDPPLAVLVIALNLARLGLVYVLSGRTRELSATELLLGGQERAAAVEALSRPETIRAFGAETSAADHYVAHMAKRLNATLVLRRYGIGVQQAAAIFDAVSSGVVLWVGGSAVARHALPVGVLVAFFALRLFLQKPLESLISAAANVRRASGTRERLNDVLGSAPEERGGAWPVNGAGQLALHDVSFHYGGGRPLLERFSLTIRPGEHVAVVGRIGSGKSTLARLLSGMEQPTTGVVTLDGQSLSALSTAALRTQIGISLQDPFLIDGTVFENIALGYPQATLAEVKYAAGLACLSNVIDALPDGYATLIGAGGARLSGGQRKRLALARVLVRRPRILVLDEVTASLDPVTERRVERNLASIGCTRVSITHRAFAAERADRVLVLESGHIAEQGTFAELLARRGLFWSLFDARA